MNNIVRKKFLYFLLFPFISSLTAIKNIKSQSSLIIIITFFLIFGLSFNPVNEKEDSYRYAQAFRQFQKDPDESFKQILDNYDLKGENVTNDKVKDIYIYAMFYLSSKIGGNNIHILFLLFASVFTFFCIGSLKYIINNNNFSYCLVSYILLFLFFYSNPIYNINGVRFWTASWVAIYISFHIIVDKNYKWFFALLILPLIHIGFLFYIGGFCISFIIRKHTNILFKIFIISFFFGQLGLIILDSIEGFLPPILQQLIWSYTESNYIMNKMYDLENEPLYAKILTSLPRYYELFLLFWAAKNRKMSPTSPIMGFTLAFFSIINLFALIPSLGARYYTVGYPFIIYIWIDNLPFLKKYKGVLLLTPIVYAYVIFRLLRNLILVTPITLYTSNFFHIIFKFIMS